ncbi:MAG: hypothetical protein JSU96_09570 [Acidobacteriota bacterium]|nr:MAG: hypothetical protein JSU96_09570 [Acidobacteriota bacterium]
MGKTATLLLACVALLLLGCGEVVKFEGEWERLNRDLDDVAAPSEVNEYAIAFDGDRMLSAWTGIREDRTVLQVAISRSGSEASQVERFVLDTREGIIFSPKMIPVESEIVLAWMLRRKVDGGVVYDIQVCTVDNTGRFSPVTTLGKSVGIQRFHMVKTKQGELLAGSVPNGESKERKLLLFLRKGGEWKSCRLGANEEWLGEKPEISVGESSIALAWMLDGEIQAAHSLDGESWIRDRIEGTSEGVLSRVGTVGGEHWIALMKEDRWRPGVDVRLLRSNLLDSSWISEEEILRIEGRRVSLSFGRGLGDEILLGIWRSDAVKNCRRIDAAKYGGGWEVLPVNGPAEACMQSQSPSVVEVGDSTLFSWQEWNGSGGKVKLARVSRQFELWPESPLLVVEDGSEVAYSAPKLAADRGERGVLFCFSYEPRGGPMQGTINRGNLVVQRWFQGMSVGFY